MIRHTNKADTAGGGVGHDPKTKNLTGSQNRSLSLDDNPALESIQDIITEMIRPGKTVRCFRCFACGRNRALKRMSSALVFCRECVKQSRELGRRARQNQLDRTLNEVRKLLRGGLEVR